MIQDVKSITRLPGRDFRAGGMVGVQADAARILDPNRGRGPFERAGQAADLIFGHRLGRAIQNRDIETEKHGDPSFRRDAEKPANTQNELSANPSDSLERPAYNDRMRPDTKICYCHGVPFHKLWHFARRCRPQRASQMSECLGAGTGCGWCIPFLKKIHEQALRSEASAEPGPAESLIEITPEDYASRRKSYIANKEPKNQF
ncbi:MAG TPA: hypothetical protein VLM89_16220 [Phycisphaerae bacterium]|nr:hypothetical protein [Phycisphaerae bacterium]